MSQLIVDVNAGQFEEFLRDESRSVGSADSISFPETLEEVRFIVSLMGRQGKPLTIQGARTGLTGGAVPHSGHVLNLSRMNRLLGIRFDPTQGHFFLVTQPGVILSQIRQALETLNFNTVDWSQDSLTALGLLRQAGPHFFTPDPTETSASIGGMINCNASGARSFFYGPTRDYVEAIKVLLADGSMVSLRRGQQRVTNGHFSLQTDCGRLLTGNIPHYDMPAVKNASGYYLKPEMDVLDLFIGSEGTLGIIVEAELQLMPLPKAIWGVTAFFPGEEQALLFVRGVRGEDVEGFGTPPAPRPVAIEFFDARALDLLRHQKANSAAFGQILDLAPHYHTAIYVEFHGESDAEITATMLELGQSISACGGSELDTWVAANARDMEKLQLFRHAIPESVNMLIDQRRRTSAGLTKLGTDMAVPDQDLTQMMHLYHERIAALDLEGVVFGHIGNNHVHVNILPRQMDDYLRGKELYLEWARQAVSWGGTVSAEHGIGKLKTAFLAEMYGEAGLEKMRVVKQLFDPAGMLSPGNMF